MTYTNGPRIVTNGLVLHLDAGNSKSYPGSGTTWTDLCGNNNNGTLTNGPTYSSANKGSIVFDGTNDYVLINHADSLNVSLITISLCIKFGSSLSSDKVLLAKGTNSGNRSYWFYENNGVTFLFNNTASPQIPGNSLINTWCEITGVQNNTSISIFLNGSLYGSTLATSTTLSTSNLGINAYANNTYWGSAKNISNIKIYNRALSANEVSQNYNALKGRYGL